MLKKIIKILLIVLFLLLPIINSHLFDLLGIKWGFYVSGNYEFTKVMLFNVLSGIILTIYSIDMIINKTKIKIPRILVLLSIVLIISTIFSSHPYTSLLGNNSKSHSLIMFMNLIGLYILSINSSKKLLQELLITTVISALIVGILGIKEFLIPTFDYGNLSNRAISTFGHPNYLALYIIILIPIINNFINKSKSKFKRFFFSFILLISIINLFLTKSVWGIFIFFNYLIYYKFDKIISLLNKINIKKGSKSKKIFYIFYIIGIIFGIIITIKYYPEKMQSFLSRFYIWESVLNIILPDIKNIFIGSGLGTLEYIFDSFKVKELYLYENIGYTADRPHNIILYYFYHFGFFGLFFIAYLVFKIKKYYMNSIYHDSLIIFFLFLLLNFSSIIHYLIIILIGGIIYENKYEKNNILNISKNIILLIIIFSGIFGSIFSVKYYIDEYEKKNLGKKVNTNKIFTLIGNENQESVILNNGNINIQERCVKLIKYSDSVENNFLCGNILWNTNKGIAKIYYKQGLNKLPNMWDEKSVFYDNYIIKKIFVPARFYSVKFSSLTEILKRVGEK